MKKGLKITGITLGAILLLMLLLPFAFQGKIEGIIKAEGNKMLNAQFDFGQLDISLFRNFPKASVTLQDFWLKGNGEFANDTLIRAKELTAAVNLLSLFGDKGYDISKIYLENTYIHAIVLSDGKVNWDIMKPDTATVEATASENPSSPFKIKLQHFVIKDLNLIYDDRQGNVYADIQHLSADCVGDLSSDLTNLQLLAETKALTYKANGIPFLSNANVYAKMNVEADLINNKYTLKENEFRLNAIQTSIDGWLAFKGPAINMDLKLNTNEIGFKDILSLVPAIYSKEFSSIKTDGTASLTAYAKGTLQNDTVPEFNVDMQIRNAMFRYPALPAGVDQINVNANIKNPGGYIDHTTISIHPLSFRLAGNPFSITADIKTPVSDPDIRAEAKGILNLSMIKQVYPLENMELNGIINADMKLSTCVSDIEQEKYDKVQASGTINVTGMKLKMKDMPDVEIQKSLFTFTPQYLQLSETTVNIGKNDLTADSRFENYLGYALKGTTLKGELKIRSNFLNLNDFITTSTSEVTDSASTHSATSSNRFEVPRNIVFQMDANMKQVLFNKMTFNNMEGKLVIKDAKVDMKNLSMNTMGGNIVMNGQYSAKDSNSSEMNAGFKMTDIGFAQAYKELDMIQKMAPIFENLKGNFSGSFNIQTYLDTAMSPVLNTMQGNGNLSTHNLSLSGIKVIDQIAEAIKQPSLKDMKVKDMNLNFVIKDGRITTHPFDIKLGDYVMNLSGSTGLDQSIDYSGKIKLPDSAGSIAKLSTLDIKIGGTFQAPKVGLDTKSMTNQAVEAVTDKAINEIGKKLGLDSATTANKDSIKEKVKEKAVEKALDFLKKKIK